MTDPKDKFLRPIPRPPPLPADMRPMEPLEEPPTARMKTLPPAGGQQARSTFPPREGEGMDLIATLRLVLRNSQSSGSRPVNLAKLALDIRFAEVVRELDPDKQNGCIRIECVDGSAYLLFINPSGKMSGVRIGEMTMINYRSSLLCLFPAERKDESSSA